MNDKSYLLSEVATILEIKGYRITYALVNGLVPEPQRERISNKRIFSWEDVERLAEHFGVDIIQNNTKKGKK
ncbi:MAG: hypothetical protein HQ567_24440 [Candidatus Nealsonbacteria bacterium]|nr:hypothetical protein [Candidatus Nealsonbacteria bacterium]